MAEQNDAVDVPDLSNETAALGSGSTAVPVPEAWYPNIEGGEWGVAARDHGDRIELRNVTGWNLVESDSENEIEVIDWIADSLREGGVNFVWSVWLDTFRYEVMDGEGDSHVIELETEERR